MSKRFADAQGGGSRYGLADEIDSPSDPPRKATAAQLAKRSIKPLKRGGTSRSTSPSKLPTPPVNNPFGGAPQQSQQPFQASSFTFGASQPAAAAANPFAGLSQSQSFSGFGASTTTPASTFSPLKTSFDFGASAPAPAPNGTSSSFTFGANPTPGTLTDAEVKEIEDAGPKLAASGKFAELEKIVRESDDRYKNATSLAGLNLKELPVPAQQKLLNFVRNPDQPNQAAQAPKPSTSFTFGASTPAATPSPTFGASTPAPATAAPLTGFGASTSAAPTNSFGASTATTSAPSFQFGASTSTAAPITFGASTSTAPPVSFGASTPAAPSSGFGASTSTNPFANLGRSTADSTPKPAPSFGAKPAESPAPVTFSGFGASTTPAEKPAEPAPQSTPFKGFGASAAPTPKPAEEVSYPSLNGAASSQPESTPASPAPKFDFTKPETPKPASKGLGASMFSSTPAQTSAATPSFQFGNTNSSTPKADAAPAATPFKFGAPAPSASPAPAKDATAPFTFGTPTPSEAPAPKQDSTPKTNFGASFAAPSAAAPAAASPAPAFNGFSATQPSAGANPFAANGVATSKPSPSVDTVQKTTSVSLPSVSETIAQKNRELNEAVRRFLVSADSSRDWSPIMCHFLEQHSAMRKNGRTDSISNSVPTPARSIQPQASASTPLGSSTLNKRKSDNEANRDDTSKRSKAGSDFSQSVSSPNKPFSQTASLFNDILNTPNKENIPASAPAVASSQSSQPTFSPSTSTATAVETPKANPFATLTKVNNTPAAPPAVETPKPAATSGFQFKSSTTAEPAKTAATPAASPFQFKPVSSSTTSTTSAAPALEVPKFGASSATSAAPALAVPKFGSGGGGFTNFMSSFGARAADEEKKEREKRKAEDFDSDEDDEAEWEKKDAEEQAAKRQKMLADAAAAAKPTFKPVSSSSSASVFKIGGGDKTTAPAPAPESGSSNIFGFLSGKKNDEDDEEDEDSDEDAETDDKATPAKPASTAPAKSLFERIEKPSNGDKPVGASTPFKFGSTPSTNNIFSASTTSTAGDNTWKGAENTPIKFGASKVSDAGTTTPEGSPAKSAFGGFTATSIHDKPAPRFSFGGGASTSSPSQSQFGGSIFSSSAKPAVDASKPASPAASGLNASIFSPAAKPSGSSGFTFGGSSANGASASATATPSVFAASTTTSRDTTPATNGDAEGSGNDANEPSDEVKDAPTSDLAALTPDEIAKNDVLFESKAKASQFTKEKGWESKGLGIFRLLKDKETGKHWVLMRMTPSGRVMLNFSLLSKKIPKAYTTTNKMCRMTVAGEDKKMETWNCTFGTVEKVEDLIAKITAGQPEE